MLLENTWRKKTNGTGKPRFAWKTAIKMAVVVMMFYFTVADYGQHWQNCVYVSRGLDAPNCLHTFHNDAVAHYG